MARDLAPETAPVDHYELVGISHRLYVHGRSQVLTGRFEVLPREYPEAVKHLLILPGSAQPVAVVRVPEAAALLAPPELVVDGLHPLVAVAVHVVVRDDHNAQYVLGPQHRTHSESTPKAELVLA